jgi:hypothetical protein
MDFHGKPDDPAVKSRPAALILVVDDDADCVAALQLLLSSSGSRSGRRMTAALQKLPAPMQFSALFGPCSVKYAVAPS